MTPEEKKYRIKYLWYKVKTLYNTVRFLMYVTSIKDAAIQEEEDEENNDKAVMVEEVSAEIKDENQADVLCFGMTSEDFMTLWLCFMSIIHWLNMLSTPVALLWPDTFAQLNYFMWTIEFCFLFDIFRKCFHKKPRSKAIDVYEIFVEYVKSNLILDLISLLPVTLSGLDP